MVTDGQVLELWRWLGKGTSLAASARMAHMEETTAKKYREDRRLPSARKTARDYRTRVDSFEKVWEDVQVRLEAEPKLKAKTLFEWLRARHPGQLPDSIRRTFERRVAKWRSLFGPNRPVMFEQVHHAGRVAASDFTVMNELGVKIAGHRFDHTLFHCVLTYSNVESVSLCFSESFEALSAGIQKAFWEFGGVPQRHRTDSLSAAVNNHADRQVHTARYQSLMTHYDCQPERTNARCANENGDVESSHGHLKDRVDQALLLRGRRDFAHRAEYEVFLSEVIAQASHLEYLSELTTLECDARRESRIKKRLSRSKLPLGQTWDSFEWNRLPLAVTRQMETLRDGTFLNRRENLLIFGGPGSGKSHALWALSEQLIHQGRSLLFTTCSLLVQQRLVAKRDLRLEKVIKQLSGFEGLILDDLGYVQQSREEVEVLFTLLAERYERGSVLLTSNLAFSKWDQIFKDAMTTAAAIDRLVHHSVILELNVPSSRVKTAKHTKSQAKAPAVPDSSTAP